MAASTDGMGQGLGAMITAHGTLAGRGPAREHGRTTRAFGPQWRIVSGAIGTALLVLLVGMAVGRARVASPAPGVADHTAAFCPGDCQLDARGGPARIPASTVSRSTAAYTFPEVYGSDEASPARGAGSPPRQGPGVGDSEYAPGEGPCALPTAPAWEIVPQLSPQP